MNGWRFLIGRGGWFLAWAMVAVALWAAYERGVAGRAYRWTDWRELALDRPWTTDGPLPELGPRARSLVGTAVFLVAQKGDWLGDESTGHVLPTLHMPHRDDFDPATADIGVKTADAAKFENNDTWGMVRTWGRLRLTRDDGASVPARYAGEVPLELVVDRIEADPPFLPSALAPNTRRAWMAWACGAGLAGALVGPALRLIRLLWRVRLVTGAIALGSSLLATATLAAWVGLPGVVGVDLYDGRSTLNTAAGRSGFFVQWTGDYSGYSIPRIRTYWRKDHTRAPSGPIGFRAHSYYTRYDWGNIHAHVDVAMSPVWLEAALGPLAYFAFRQCRRPRVTPGRCVQCGYDLRATPTTCPECGRRVIA